MPFDFTVFMSKINQDNTHFKRFALSSHMDPLIKELKGKTFISPIAKAKIQQWVAFLPHAEQQKYTQTLAYLAQQGCTLVMAIPCKPVMTFEKLQIRTGMYEGYNGAQKQAVMLDPDSVGSPGPRSFLHVHKLTWAPSNGNKPSLATVLTREHVKFLADTQAPPFNNIQDPDREFYMPANGSVATGCENYDDHSSKLPALICRNPRVAGVLRGEQRYQYSTDQGHTWENLPGGEFLLEKSVRKEGNDWIFMFKKTNWAPHNTKRFHFEVHYKIGPAPLYLPRNEGDVSPMNMGTLKDADLKRFACKVVR